jgi:hypothetical protein
MDFYILFGYIAFVALILVVKHSDGHNIRTIARARRSALYEGHPWEPSTGSSIPTCPTF